MSGQWSEGDVLATSDDDGVCINGAFVPWSALSTLTFLGTDKLSLWQWLQNESCQRGRDGEPLRAEDHFEALTETEEMLAESDAPPIVREAFQRMIDLCRGSAMDKALDESGLMDGGA